LNFTAFRLLDIGKHFGFIQELWIMIDI